MELNEIRLKIDEIDKALLPLFLERMACARQVAAIKKERGLPILNTDRENEILDHVAKQAGIMLEKHGCCTPISWSSAAACSITYWRRQQAARPS